MPRHPAGEHAGIPNCIPRTRLLTGGPGKNARYCASARLCCSMQGEEEGGDGVGGEKNACARSGCAGRGFALG